MSTGSASKPSRILRTLLRLRTNSPAPTSSTTDSAPCRKQQRHAQSRALVRPFARAGLEIGREIGAAGLEHAARGR